MCPRPSQGKLLYHMTLLSNIPSILEKGFLSRNKLREYQINFYDIADEDIIYKQKTKFVGYDLSDYIHFHFFSKNPFHKNLVCRYGSDNLAIITIFRPMLAEKMKRYKIIPSHPLSKLNPDILDYENGMNSISWALIDDYAMNGRARDYDDSSQKTVTMAECIVYGRIEPKDIAWIFINSNSEYQELMDDLRLKHPTTSRWWKKIVVREYMFPKVYSVNNFFNDYNNNRTYNNINSNRTYNNINSYRTYNNINSNRTYTDINYNKANININYNNYNIYNYRIDDDAHHHHKKAIEYKEKEEEGGIGGFFSLLTNLCTIC